MSSPKWHEKDLHGTKAESRTLIFHLPFCSYNHIYSFFFGIFILVVGYMSTAYPLFKQFQSSYYLPSCKDWLVFPSLSCRLVSRVYRNPLLTSGKVEMLLFSKFNSSSALHFANDLGIADSLLYLRPRRLKLDRFPVNTQKKGISFNPMSLSLSQAINQYLWITLKHYFSKILNFLYQETAHYTLSIRMKLKPLSCPLREIMKYTAISQF